MNEPLVIAYPRGGGGSWLANLIWHLENNDFSLPKVDVIFDNQPRTKNITFPHMFEVISPEHPEEISVKVAGDHFLFSTDCLFNMFINDAFKVRFKIFKLGNQTIDNQLFTLSDSFRYIWTDKNWHKFYCNQIDLLYNNVFQNPELFVDELFKILHSGNIQFTPNIEYALNSVNHYKQTCIDPETIFGNVDSIVWLACCHAVTMLHEIPLPISIDNNTSFGEIQNALRCFDLLTQKFVKPRMFIWN